MKVYDKEDIRKDAKEMIVFLDKIIEDCLKMKEEFLKILNFQTKEGNLILETFKNGFELPSNLIIPSEIKLYEFNKAPEIDSKIITTQEELNTIKSWLPGDKKLGRLLYRGTKDGFLTTDFH